MEDARKLPSQQAVGVVVHHDFMHKLSHVWYTEMLTRQRSFLCTMFCYKFIIRQTRDTGSAGSKLLG